MELATHTKVSSREDIEHLISAHSAQLRSFGIEGISLFGSFRRNTEIRSDSDVDFVVEFIPGRKNYDNFFDLAVFLESLLGRHVDLLTRESLRSQTGKQISETSLRIPI